MRCGCSCPQRLGISLSLRWPKEPAFSKRREPYKRRRPCPEARTTQSALDVQPCLWKGGANPMTQCPSAHRTKCWPEPGVREARRRLASRTRALRVRWGLCLFFALVATGATAAPARDLTTRFGGVYKRPLTGNPASLDPAYATDVYAYAVVN